MGTNLFYTIDMAFSRRELNIIQGKTRTKEGGEKKIKEGINFANINETEIWGHF